MDFWVVALRGTDDALIEARAVLGPPENLSETLHSFILETVDPAVAASALASVVKIDGIAGGVSLAGAQRETARERAAALACAASTNEILFDSSARLQLDRVLIFVRPTVRPGWRLPIPAVAIVNEHCLRSLCRDAVTSLPNTPRFVARNREFAALSNLLASDNPIVVIRSEQGDGGGRLIEEALHRAGNKVVRRVTAGALTDSDETIAALLELKNAWVVVDPVNEPAVRKIIEIRALGSNSCRWILRASAELVIQDAPIERDVVMGALREYDAQAIVHALLGAMTSTAITGRLARRAERSPLGVVEAVRAAVQLGELIPSGDAWTNRKRRGLRSKLMAVGNVTERRIADLPQQLHRALVAAAGIDDGSPQEEVLAAIRGATSSQPQDFVSRLQALGLLRVVQGSLRWTESIRKNISTRDGCVDALRTAGSLQAGAKAEALLRAGKPRDAAEPFAEAAKRALNAKLLAAAVRYIAVAVPSDRSGMSESVRAVLKSIALAIGPTVVIEAEGDALPRTRALDVESLEQAAKQMAERNDEEGAARLEALAEVARGNAQRALRLSDKHSMLGSSKGQLVAALAHAGAGDLQLAIRTALGALVTSRRGREAGGEAAALAVLSTLYKVAGRDAESKVLAEGARKLGGKSIPVGPPSE